MGTEENPIPIFISENLTSLSKRRTRGSNKGVHWCLLLELLRHVAVRSANCYASAQYQAKCQASEIVKMLPINVDEAIETKVKKLINSCFIREEQHPNWVANIILMLEKNDKIWIYTDFQDLNATYPTDEFSLLITNIMIDNTCEFLTMSFMDGLSGYSQIKIYHEDKKHMAFRMPLEYIVTLRCPLDWKILVQPINASWTLSSKSNCTRLLSAL